MGIIEISISYKLLILTESRYIFLINTGLDMSVLLQIFDSQKNKSLYTNNSHSSIGPFSGKNEIPPERKTCVFMR